MRNAASASPPPPLAATAHLANDAYLAAFECQAPAGQPAAGLTLAARQQHRSRPSQAAPKTSPAPGPAAASPPSAPGGASSPASAPPARAARLGLSDRNLLCASVDWQRGEAVFGSADHAAYAVDLHRAAKGRTLFSKAAGHQEWVTAVAHLPDGQVVTGGQDSAIWLWTAAAAAAAGPAGRGSVHRGAGGSGRPVRLEGHAGPVSQLAVMPSSASGAAEGEAFVSASYDKKLILWGSSSSSGSTGGSKGSQAAWRQQVLAGHRAPALELRLAGSLAASGDRDGALLLWDLQAGAALAKPLAAHQGHCTALEWWGAGSSAPAESEPSPLLLSGGQDGCVRLWDCRRQAGQALAQQACAAAHAGAAGCGAVGGLAAGLAGGAAALVASVGDDCTARGLDSRRGLEAAWTAQLPDFPYCLATAAGGAALLVGCGDGSIVALDAGTGSELWRLAAAESAVRTVHAGGRLLLAGCDDGCAVIYSWDTGGDSSGGSTRRA